MLTTSDVLDQHLKCFGENDLDGVLADYVIGSRLCSYPADR